LTTALTNGVQVNLGAGSNKLTLANLGNTGSVSNVGTLIGGTVNDTITLNTALVNGSIDLGTGSDTLQFADLTNRASVANTETVFGGTGSDTIVLTGSNASLIVGGAGMNFVTGNTGADQFVLDQNSAGDYTIVTNFSVAAGDKIALDTTGSAILGNDTYDLGGAGIVDGTNMKAVADAATRLTIAEATGGKGGFVYQQDTAELYYSANGNFAGGGTVVGVIDTNNNSTPWIYNSSSFMQV
jgi:Ca2+-binding RTX toxin-like protein